MRHPLREMAHSHPFGAGGEGVVVRRAVRGYQPHQSLDLKRSINFNRLKHDLSVLGGGGVVADGAMRKAAHSPGCAALRKMLARAADTEQSN